MNLHRYTIKKLLSFTSTIILLSFLLFTSIYYIRQQAVRQDKNILQRLDQLEQNSLRIKMLQDEFLLRDFHNSQLYVLGQSPATLRLDSLFTKTLEELNYLKKYFSSTKITEVERHIEQYKKNFNNLKELEITRGFRDYGLEGDLRNIIHQVEGNAVLNNDYRLLSGMLMLRRHEKDYMLRRDTLYVEKFDATLASTLNYAADKYGANNQFSKQLIDYSKLFHEFLSIDAQIGRTENEGATYQLQQQSALVIESIRNLYGELSENIKKKDREAYASMLMLLVIVSSLVLTLLTKISRHITKTIKSTLAVIKKLGKGELPPPLEVKGADEFSAMEKSINDLSLALRNTRDFAIEVGNGNFYSEVNVFGNSGELGSGLLEMRQKLTEVAVQQENSLKEKEQRSWLNECLAQVSELLRNFHSDTKELCFEFVRFAIKSTGSLQGGIYLLNSEGESDSDENSYLELVASYAYDRRKYINKRFEKYEGVVGSCLYEKDVIYITDIPDSYTHITTGLGVSNPSCIVLTPLVTEKEEALGVMEISSYSPITDIQVEFMKQACRNLASSLVLHKAIKANEQIIAQMKVKTEELLANEEELRQNMEELTAIREDMERREKDLNGQIAELKYKLRLHGIIFEADTYHN
ncbi:MAG TPA: HAMP domain-containing protein [Tenuifilaceae bacterium]|nr:HAMP domain-containing protein [Tenuifilaceae bacterium]